LGRAKVATAHNETIRQYETSVSGSSGTLPSKTFDQCP